MDASLVATALLHAAWKRGLLDAAQRDRLLAVFAASGLQDTEAVRRWLEAGQGLDPAVGRRLAKLLVKPEQARLGGYRLLAELDEGGMGTVHLASASEGGLVVVKTLRKNLAQVDEYRHRFARETALMRQLDHPCLVRYLDAGEESGTPYLVLEYVAGSTVKDLAGRRGLGERDALGLIWQVLDALVLVGSQRLIHRDIKPSNVFAVQAGTMLRAKLGDFGLARTTDQATALTQEGAQVGTPHYMSPEQIRAVAALDPRSDIYAVGAVLYFLLTGRDPYAGARYEVMHAHCSAPVPQVRQVDPALHPATEAVITRAMQKEPDGRYPDAAAMQAAVAEALAAVGGEVAVFRQELAVAREAARGPQVAAAPATALLPTPRGLPAQPSAAPAADAVADVPPRLDQTLPADLLGQWRQHADRPLDQTLPADLLGEWRRTMPLASEAQQRTPPPSPAIASTPTSPRGSSAGLGGPTELGDRLQGDFAQAAHTDWLCLREVGGSGRVLLWARPMLLLGKLRQAPVDLCLRNYPVAVHKEHCQRVSRQQVRLSLHVDGAQIEDLGSANGTRYDGVDLLTGRAQAIAPGAEHVLEVAGVIALRLRALRPAAAVLRLLPGAPPAQPGSCGLDCAHPVDAVLLTRPDNAPEICYAQVLRRLSLGGSSAELRLDQSLGPEQVELALWGGRWLRRAGGPWEPLVLGSRLRAAGRAWRVDPASHDDFN